MKKESFFRFLISAVFGGAIFFFFPHTRDMTAASILRRAPSDFLPSVLFLLALYAGKGLSFFFPLAALEAAAGILYPIKTAIIINLAGISFSLSLPWFLGRSGRGGYSSLLERHPTLQNLHALRGNDCFIFMVRISNLFPLDAVSCYLGASGATYPIFLSASLLGCLPQLITITILASSLDHLTPKIILTILAVNLALVTAALTGWKIFRSRSARLLHRKI